MNRKVNKNNYFFLNFFRPWYKFGPKIHNIISYENIVRKNGKNLIWDKKSYHRKKDNNSRS